jgi:hypothetical protein
MTPCCTLHLHRSLQTAAMVVTFGWVEGTRLAERKGACVCKDHLLSVGLHGALRVPVCSCDLLHRWIMNVLFL